MIDIFPTGYKRKKKKKKKRNYINLTEHQLFVKNHVINLTYDNPFVFTVHLSILLLELFADENKLLFFV